MTNIYLVMTSRQTWGKGPDPVVALYNACQGYSDIEQAQIYRFTWTKEIKWPEALMQISVDGMGAVAYPKDVQVEDLGVLKIKGIPAKFLTIQRRLMTFIDEVDLSKRKAASKLVKPSEDPSDGS